MSNIRCGGLASAVVSHAIAQNLLPVLPVLLAQWMAVRVIAPLDGRAVILRWSLNVIRLFWFVHGSGVTHTGYVQVVRKLLLPRTTLASLYRLLRHDICDHFNGRGCSLFMKHYVIIEVQTMPLVYVSLCYIEIDFGTRVSLAVSLGWNMCPDVNNCKTQISRSYLYSNLKGIFEVVSFTVTLDLTESTASSWHQFCDANGYVLDFIVLLTGEKKSERRREREDEEEEEERNSPLRRRSPTIPYLDYQKPPILAKAHFDLW